MEKSKGFAPLVIIILIAIGAVGFLAYQSTKPKLQTYIPSPIPTPQKTDKSTRKTYLNKQYLYSVEYPADFQLIEAKQGDQTQQCCDTILLKDELQKVTFEKDSGNFQITIFENPNSLTFPKWSEEHYLFTKVTGEKTSQITGNTTLAGKHAIRASLFQYDSTKIAIATEYNGKFYELQYDGINPNDMNFEKNKQIYAQILSSFKFLDP